MLGTHRGVVCITEASNYFTKTWQHYQSLTSISESSTPGANDVCGGPSRDLETEMLVH